MAGCCKVMLCLLFLMSACVLRALFCGSIERLSIGYFRANPKRSANPRPRKVPRAPERSEGARGTAARARVSAQLRVGGPTNVAFQCAGDAAALPCYF